MTVTTRLTDAPVIAWDCSPGGGYVVELGGDRTLGVPSETIEGNLYMLLVEQDAAGSRLLSYAPGYYKFVNGTPPTLSTAAGAQDQLIFVAEIGSLNLISFSTRIGTQPAAPSNLTATGGIGVVNLEWVNNAFDDTAIDVQRYDSNSFIWGSIGDPLAPTVTTYQDMPETPGTYLYRVIAKRGIFASPPSNTASGESTEA